MTRIFALTTRGLETVSARELAMLPQVTVTETGYRRVAAVCQGALAPLLNLRTVDDVFVEVALWHGIERPRATLDRLRELAAQLDLSAALDGCRQVRVLPASPSFSLTANFVGRRNYNTDEIKQAVAAGLVTQLNWLYTEDDAAAALNVRLFIEHTLAHVGVRLGETSLQRRPYKQLQIPGSLKPPVAAAMLALAETAAGQRLLDPCCGAGTILIEAAQQGALVRGGDLDKTAVAAAKTNAAAASVTAIIEQWDARSLPIEDSSIDRIVSNLPWGRQVAVDGALHALYGAICSELRRVLAPGGRIALLTSAPQLIDLGDLPCAGQSEISLFGQTPVIAVYYG